MLNPGPFRVGAGRLGAALLDGELGGEGPRAGGLGGGRALLGAADGGGQEERQHLVEPRVGARGEQPAGRGDIAGGQPRYGSSPRGRGEGAGPQPNSGRQ